MYKENSCTKVQVFGVHNFEPSPILYHKIYLPKPHKKSGSKVAIEINHLIYTVAYNDLFHFCSVGVKPESVAVRVLLQQSAHASTFNMLTANYRMSNSMRIATLANS